MREIKIDYFTAPDLLLNPKTTLVKTKKKRDITFNAIVQSVCDAYGITPEQVFTRTRKREILYPRQIIHYFCHRYFKYGRLENLANKTKMVSHATVLNSIKTVKNLRDTDFDFRQRIEFIDYNLNLHMNS